MSATWQRKRKREIESGAERERMELAKTLFSNTKLRKVRIVAEVNVARLFSFNGND